MKLPELNRPAISRPIRNKNLDIRVYSNDRYNYLDRTKMILKSSKSKPIYRYAKSYEVDNTAYALLLISHENDTRKIESFLDDMSEKIKTENTEVVPEDLVYLDTYYGG